MKVEVDWNNLYMSKFNDHNINSNNNNGNNNVIISQR